jgi:hypothetical protein
VSKDKKSKDDTGRRSRSRQKESVCFWCGKPGHRQQECYTYKKAHEAYKAEKIEHVNTVSHFSQSESTTSSLYPETQYAFVTNSNGNWAVDSRATRHFSGFIKDYTSFKRWLVPRKVQLANGSTFEASGYGDITLNTTKGPYALKDVWYTPEFTCRLVSTFVLNSCGIKVTLENHRLFAEFKGKLVFEGTCDQGLCYIDQPVSIALTANSAASQSVLPAT